MKPNKRLRVESRFARKAAMLHTKHKLEMEQLHAKHQRQWDRLYKKERATKKVLIFDELVTVKTGD